MCRKSLLGIALVGTAWALAACGGGPAPALDSGPPAGDGGTDAGAPETCAGDGACDDGLFCNGPERCRPMDPGADAYGCVGLSCESPDEVDATIEKAMEINDVPVVVDFRVHKDAMVWPMVAAGASNDDIKYARDLAPDFDEDDL